MGLFIDGIIGSIIRTVRRERRRSQALRWDVADGAITRFTTSYGFPTLPLLDYAYTVSGQAHDGSATGSPIKDDQINQIGDLIDSLSSVKIRYDPAKPERSRLLNEDNPRIPFDIDHLEH
ncbi:MAG TPA: hypothetical protein VN678_06895 [Acidobacteriaceae bacterium]|nr:hypothetical protein [Acidobacteriaceae bacterium]